MVRENDVEIEKFKVYASIKTIGTYSPSIRYKLSCSHSRHKLYARLPIRFLSFQVCLRKPDSLVLEARSEYWISHMIISDLLLSNQIEL